MQFSKTSSNAKSSTIHYETIIDNSTVEYNTKHTITAQCNLLQHNTIWFRVKRNGTI